jgi:hypothetical protein
MRERERDIIMRDRDMRDRDRDYHQEEFAVPMMPPIREPQPLPSPVHGAPSNRDRNPPSNPRSLDTVTCFKVFLSFFFSFFKENMYGRILNRIE